MWPEWSVEPDDHKDEVPESWRTFEFLQPLRVMSSTGLGIAEDASMLVFEGLRFRGNHVLACHDPRPFEDFIRYHPLRQRGERTSSASRAKIPMSVQELLLQECPWLSTDDFHQSTSVAKKRARDDPRPPIGHAHVPVAIPHGDDDAPDSDASAGDHPAGDHAVDVGLELAEMRLAVAELDPEAQPYFGLILRGGRWTLEHAGVVADFAMGIQGSGNSTLGGVIRISDFEILLFSTLRTSWSHTLSP
jgi:hypothetical protein